MTTLIGIHARKGVPGIVLASDITSTHGEWQPRGDISVLERTQVQKQKIYESKCGNFAVCATGNVGECYEEFLHQFVEGELEFEEALKTKTFEPIMRLHRMRFRNRSWVDARRTELLIASRYDGKLGLHQCYPMGHVSEDDFITMGSGWKYASKVLEDRPNLISRNVSIDEAVELAHKAVNKASSDMHTRGFDLYVISEDGIRNYGNEIRDKIQDAETKAISAVRKEVSKIKRPEIEYNI